MTQFLPSMWIVPRTVNAPRPVVMYSRRPAVSTTVAPHPQSGPGISFTNLSSVMFGGLQQCPAGGHHFARIVGRHLGGPALGDTDGTVAQQHRPLRRQHRGFVHSPSNVGPSGRRDRRVRRSAPRRCRQPHLGGSGRRPGCHPVRGKSSLSVNHFHALETPQPSARRLRTSSAAVRVQVTGDRRTYPSTNSAACFRAAASSRAFW